VIGDYIYDPPPQAQEGDGSSVETQDDGSLITSLPDGTSRVDYPDGSIMVLYPDSSVLNVYPDGSRTLTDGDGTAYDPYSGAPLNGIDVPKYGAQKIQAILSGGEVLGTIDEAKELIETAIDAVRGEVDPTSWVGRIIDAVLEVVTALETEERGCFLRSWCYTLVYVALDMGVPPTPNFAGSLGGPEQDELDRQAWTDGVAEAQEKLQYGADGVAIRNKVLIQLAIDGGYPQTTLQKLWQAACASSEDDELAAAYDSLSWPEPTGA
jgi:hypothetical protein